MQNPIIHTITQKLMQWGFSIFSGTILAIDTSVDFFVPCLIAVILDVVSAYFLSRRVHKKYPDKSDGKFKSEYKYRILLTMLVVFLVIIAANHVDIAVRMADDKLAVRWVVGVFMIYEVWSILENWSSENDNKFAKVLQRIMVNKAERHLNVPLKDILIDDNDEGSKSLKGSRVQDGPHGADGANGQS